MGPLCMRIYHCSIMHGRLEFDPHNVQEAIAAVRIICVQCFYYILKFGVLEETFVLVKFTLYQPVGISWQTKSALVNL